MSRSQSRLVPLDLRLHLRGGGAAQGIAGVEAAAQAEHVVHVFVDGGVEFLQHVQRQLRQVALVRCGGFDGVGDGFVRVAEG